MHDFVALIAEALDQGLRQLRVILGQQESHGWECISGCPPPAL
jgi:hypothetical protein